MRYLKSNRLFVSALLTLVVVGCGAPSNTQDAGSDGGVCDDAGFCFAAFTPPSNRAVPNSVLVTVSGETAATEGNAFPPAGMDPFFRDGWEVKYDHVVVTVDDVTLNENPDMNPGDPSAVGDLVAEARGPFAVDLAQTATGTLDAKEGNGKARALVRVLNQNKKSGSPSFDSTARYAFGFHLVAAVSGAQNVNLDAEAQTAYRTMAAQGFSTWVSGTATWKGALSVPLCRSTNASYNFDRVPKQVKFKFGFKAPTQYKNCVNPDLMPDETRGVQTQSNTETVAQMTFHLDHPYWEALQEDAPLRWDVLAARKSVATGAAPASVELTEVDLQGVDFQSVKDAQNNPLPWRTCGPVEAGERTAGTVAYDPNGVPVSASGGSAGLKDLYDYMTYNLSTFGHLNNDGLCFPARQYPSPQ